MEITFCPSFKEQPLEFTKKTKYGDRCDQNQNCLFIIQFLHTEILSLVAGI